MSLLSTRWVRRNTEGPVFRVVSDPNARAGTTRHLLLHNETTGRRHWATPAGLARKYIRVEDKGIA